MGKFDSMYDETPDDRCRRLEHELARQQLKTDLVVFMVIRQMKH